MMAGGDRQKKKSPEALRKTPLLPSMVLEDAQLCSQFRYLHLVCSYSNQLWDPSLGLCVLFCSIRQTHQIL